MTFLSATVLFFSGQGIFLAFLLNSQKKIKSKPWIGLFFISFSLIMVYWVTLWSDAPLLFRRLDYSGTCQLLTGPFLYLAYRESKPTLYSVHFIPAFLSLIIIIPYWTSLLTPIDLPLYYIRNLKHTIPVVFYLTITLNLFYLIRINKSSPPKEYKILSLGLLLFTISLPLYRILNFYGKLTGWIDYTIAFLVIVGFYYSGYYYFLKYHPYSTKKNSIKDPSVNEFEDADPSLKEQVDYFLQEEKPFLNPDYRLEQLSLDLGVPEKRISSLVRDCGSSNFNEFINRYRIDLAKKILKKSNAKILAVALESGFSNKVTFIKNFKKFVGQTPTDYRNSKKT